jgi:2-oxo-3-hexenedioate decarboxylase
VDAVSTEIDIDAEAEELVALLGTGRQTRLLTDRYPQMDMADAYRVADGVRRLRIDRGEIPIGRKIGFTNFRMWQNYAVKAPIWGSMYNSSVRSLHELAGAFSLAGLPEPKIEPEIVIALGSAPRPGMDEQSLLGCVDWLGLGFELVQSVFPNWGFKAPDAVAAFGLHAALFTHRRIQPRDGDWLHDLAAFRVRLSRNGEVVAEGGGADVLGSPLSALRHLNDLLADKAFGPPLASGEIVTTGTLTLAMPVAAGENWSAHAIGIDLPPIELRLTDVRHSGLSRLWS